MAHGGPRQGSGRPRGKPNRNTEETRKRAEAGGQMPLDFMLQVMRDEGQPMDARMDMAKAAAPYVHAKLASIEHSGKDGGPIVVNIVGEDAEL